MAPVLDGTSIGPLVRAARTRRGWSQRRLASVLGVGREYVSKIESGKREPSAHVIRKLVRELEIDPACALGVAPPT